MSPFERITIIDPMFLPNTSSVNHDYASLFPTDIVNIPQSPILLQDTHSEGNLCNITQMKPIDISAKPGTIEHVHVGQNCSTDESEAYKALFKEFRDIFSWSYVLGLLILPCPNLVICLNWESCLNQESI